MNEIRTIQDHEREFQKAMLTRMKQRDPEFFSDISSFPNSIVTLLEPMVDGAPRDTSSGISDSSCTSPVTHVPISEGFVCFFGGNSTPNTSKEVESFPWAVKNKKFAEFNGSDTSLVTPEPVIECSECLSDDNSILKSSEVVESLPGTVKKIDYQEQIQNTNLHFEINGTSSNSLVRRLQVSLTGSRQHG